MTNQLTIEDLDFILESLKYTKLKFEEYELYPTPEYKRARIDAVTDLIIKLERLKNDEK